MLRRLLHDLQKGVERPGGEHVGLVDDIHPVLCHRWGEVGLVPQVADVVHPVVAGGVNLHHIQDRAVLNPPADVAHPTGVPPRLVGAVDRFGQDFGTGGFAGSPAAGEQIGMGRLTPRDLVFEGGGDMLLPDDIFKGFGAVFSI